MGRARTSSIWLRVCRACIACSCLCSWSMVASISWNLAFLRSLRPPGAAPAQHSAHPQGAQQATVSVWQRRQLANAAALAVQIVQAGRHSVSGTVPHRTAPVALLRHLVGLLLLDRFVAASAAASAPPSFGLARVAAVRAAWSATATAAAPAQQMLHVHHPAAVDAVHKRIHGGRRRHLHHSTWQRHHASWQPHLSHLHAASRSLRILLLLQHRQCVAGRQQATGGRRVWQEAAVSRLAAAHFCGLAGIVAAYCSATWRAGKGMFCVKQIREGSCEERPRPVHQTSAAAAAAGGNSSSPSGASFDRMARCAGGGSLSWRGGGCLLPAHLRRDRGPAWIESSVHQRSSGRMHQPAQIRRRMASSLRSATGVQGWACSASKKS